MPIVPHGFVGPVHEQDLPATSDAVALRLVRRHAPAVTPYDRAFAALGRGDIPELAAALEDARTRRESAGLVIAKLLCRADLSPYRVERLGIRCGQEALSLSFAEASLEGGGRPPPNDSARRIRLGLLHDYAALVLRACGPTWPDGVAPGVVAWALAKVVVGEV